MYDHLEIDGDGCVTHNKMPVGKVEWSGAMADALGAGEWVRGEVGDDDIWDDTEEELRETIAAMRASIRKTLTHLRMKSDDGESVRNAIKELTHAVNL